MRSHEKKFHIKEYIDNFSVPEKVVKTKLATKYLLKIRDQKEKPGRKLIVLFDDRNLLQKNFKLNYCYLVYVGKDKFAGSHYHKNRLEFFYPVTGEFIIYLMNPSNGIKEQIVFKKPWMIFVPTGVAHKMYTKNGGIFLVLSNSVGKKEDEFNIEM